MAEDDRTCNQFRFEKEKEVRGSSPSPSVLDMYCMRAEGVCSFAE